MRGIERRLDHLEEKVPVPACGHKMTFLRDPTEEEVAKVRKEFDECPQCSKGGKPLIVRCLTFGKTEEAPKPEEVKEPESENSQPEIKLRFLKF